MNIKERGGVVMIAHLRYSGGIINKKPFVDQALLQRGTVAIFNPRGGCRVLPLGDESRDYLERLSTEGRLSDLGLMVTFGSDGKVVFDTEENYDGYSRSIQSGNELDGRAFRINSGSLTSDVYVGIMANGRIGLDNILRIVRNDPELGTHFKHVDSPYSPGIPEGESRL